MSLDNLVQQTGKAYKKEENVEIFLTPEYEIDTNTWKELFRVFNETRGRVKLAHVIEQYIRQNNPEKKDYSGIISIGEIVERNGRFFTDLSFETDKAGMTAFLIFKAEDLQLVPVSTKMGIGGIRHIVLCYVPE